MWFNFQLNSLYSDVFENAKSKIPFSEEFRDFNQFNQDLAAFPNKFDMFTQNFLNQLKCKILPFTAPFM